MKVLSMKVLSALKFATPVAPVSVLFREAMRFRDSFRAARGMISAVVAPAPARVAASISPEQAFTKLGLGDARARRLAQRHQVVQFGALAVTATFAAMALISIARFELYLATAFLMAAPLPICLNFRSALIRASLKNRAFFTPRAFFSRADFFTWLLARTPKN